MPSLTDLPVELLVDEVLPLVALRDVLALSVTSKDFATLCADDTFWKRKLSRDYNFSDAACARTKGYKFLYKGVHKSRVYAWGSQGEGRLGQGWPRKSRVRNRPGILNGSQPYPTPVPLAEAHIVELAAGGWSFHALDSYGSIWVWGQLDGAGLGLNIDSFSHATKRTDVATRLVLSERMTKITAGRAHAVALSRANRVWAFPSWGRPCVMTTPLFSTVSADSTPCQVECGWTLAAVLTRGGDVYVWWPLAAEFAPPPLAPPRHADEVDGAVVQGGDVYSLTWKTDARPGLIGPVAAPLPDLRGGDDAGAGETTIVKIAAGDDFLVGLTRGGHVLKADVRGGFSNPLRRPAWEYLPRFSEVEHIRAHPTFSPEREGAPDAPGTVQITHISAHFHTFFAYSTGSSSVVLCGAADTLPDSQPDIMPALQNRDVISVVLGDYHFGALTAAGKLYTWGKYSSGALGLGDPTQVARGAPGGYTSDAQRAQARRVRIVPPDVAEPTEVRFETANGCGGCETFVFGATASGWHTGALVIDLEDKEEQEYGEDGMCSCCGYSSSD